MTESEAWSVDKEGISHPSGSIEASVLVHVENPGQDGVILWAPESWKHALDFATYIKAIDLISHGLKDLPEAITRFENLEYLLVREPNPYYEAEPPEIRGPAYPESGHFLWRLAMLPKLHTLRLEFHGLRDLTANIGELWNLKNLRVEFFEGNTIPPELSQLSQLEILIIRGTRRGLSLPAQLARLENLRRLVLSHHALKKWPQSMCCLNRLEHLDLSGNELIDLPVEFASLQSLRSLNLSNNQLSKIPASIFELPELETLILSNNLIKRIPDDLCRLGKLKSLHFYDNRLKKIDSEAQRFLEAHQLLPNELLHPKLYTD